MNPTHLWQEADYANVLHDEICGGFDEHCIAYCLQYCGT
jgi:hypothetical protein